jgi:hypothetical protein
LRARSELHTLSWHTVLTMWIATICRGDPQVSVHPPK